MNNNIPGIKAVHAIISDDCRRKVEKTRVSAFTLAMQKLEAEIEPLINAHPIGCGTKFHFVLTVEPKEQTNEA